MRPPLQVLDPRLRIPLPPKDVLVFTLRQYQGKKERQEDYVANLNDECFIVCDGGGGRAHGDVAAKLACETALWAYRQVRLRRCYWLDKRQLVRRIFRTTNLTVWQKRREPGFEDGLATTLLVAIIGPRAVWVGSAGDSSSFVFHEGQLLRLTRQDRDSQGNVTRALGFVRLGLWPNAAQQRFIAGDTMLLATNGATSVLSTSELSKFLDHAGDTAQSLSEAAEAMLQKAKDNGGTDNMTVCLIKRIALPR